SLRGALTGKDAKFLDDWWKSVNRDEYFSAADRDDLAEHALLALGQALGEKAKDTAIQVTTARPATVAARREFLLPGQGHAAAGERVFCHSKGPRCFVCHKIDGRGEAVGPDLSHIGAAMKREKLIESILEPSKEIAPAFVTWLITTRDGKQHTGVIVEEGAHSTLTLANAQGKLTVLKITEIEDRVAQPTSLMPADLRAQMTRREFVDLLAFLEGRKYECSARAATIIDLVHFRPLGDWAQNTSTSVPGATSVPGDALCRTISPFSTVPIFTPRRSFLSNSSACRSGRPTTLGTRTSATSLIDFGPGGAGRFTVGAGLCASAGLCG